jgi:hypothetical protein
MRYELSDHEWDVINSMLPNKPRGIPRVDDRCLFWVLRSGAPRTNSRQTLAFIKLASIRIWLRESAPYTASSSFIRLVSFSASSLRSL